MEEMAWSGELSEADETGEFWEEETENKANPYVFSVSLPGADPDSVSVFFGDNMMYVRYELPSFSLNARQFTLQSFALPGGIDKKRAKAIFEKGGKLRIFLPKIDAKEMSLKPAHKKCVSAGKGGDYAPLEIYG